MLKRVMWAAIVVCILMATLLSSLVTIPEGASALTPHSPIRIYGDADFTAANGVTGGSGTFSDPYIIELWDIESSGFEYGIVIEDTISHFVIRYVYVHSGDIEVAAISLSNVFNGTISDSRIFGYGVTIGMGSGANFTIKNNDITGGWSWGMRLASYHNVTFTGNEIAGRLGGIAAIACTDLTYNGNTIQGGIWPVDFYEDDNVKFTWNNVSGFGSNLITLFNSTNTSIHHNNFIGGMSPQSSDNLGAENSWDDGYPSGGNYWSEYNGTDLMNGPNQDIPGGDGIGDTPHVIDADSQDRYPLMSAPSPPPGRRPPSILSELSGQNWENVTISWGLSEDDGQNYKTIVAYHIYRNMTYDRAGLGYQLIGTVPNGTSEFIDVAVGEGDPTTYFYRVCSVDVSNNIVCAYLQVLKWTRPLKKGLNLVSAPVVPVNTSLESVFQTVRFDKLWTQLWTSPTSSYEWKSHSILKPYNEELLFYAAKGTWINVTEDSNFTIAGRVSGAVVYLRPGWNLISFPSFNLTYNVTVLKNETNISRIEGFDPSAPPYNLRVLDDSEVLQTGYGYWVYSESYVQWLVPLT